MIRRPPRPPLFPSTPLSRSARDRDELRAWDARVLRLLATAGLDDEIRYVTEPKIDGLAVALVYRHGVLERGATRGDRKSTRLNSSHANISYAVFCLKKKTRS